MSSGAVTNMAGLIVCRCFLGIFEAGFGAGAPYYLSLFYQRKELGLRVSLLLGMSPLANCFAASLAYGITHIKGSIAPWRLLFIIGKSLLLMITRRLANGIPRGCTNHTHRSSCFLFPSRCSTPSQVPYRGRTNRSSRAYEYPRHDRKD